MKLIQKHLENICASLIRYYDLTSISSHSGNLGLSRELITKHFLCSNLPSNLDFTSGEIFDSCENRTGQVDIIIHSKFSLKLNIANEIDLIPVDNVLAAIECKSNLTTGSMSAGKSHLKLALDSCVKTKRLTRINPIGIDASYLRKNKLPENTLNLLENNSGILASHKKTPYMILSFKGPKKDTLIGCLFDYMKANEVALEDMPNVITILNKGYYLVKNDGFFIKKVPGNVHWSAPQSSDATLMGIYLYLAKLAEVQKLSENFFPLEDYLR